MLRMPRARNIKPALFKNELLGQADPLLTILFIGLWTLADRDGKLEDRPLRIKAEIFPYRDLPDFNGYLTELERLDFIHRYTAQNMSIIHIKNFSLHQHPHRTEKLSDLPGSPDETGLTCKEPLNNGEVTEAARLIPDSSNTDSSNTDSGKVKKPRTRFTPPDVAQVKAYCLERKNSVDPEKFIDHYTSNGWKVGKNPMKDWQAAVRTWEKTTHSRTGVAQNAESIIAYLNQEDALGNL